MRLRDYQTQIVDRINALSTDALVQLETGAGKTPIEAELCQREPSLFIAHRNILIAQASEKLAAFGLDHDTISTEHTRRVCAAAHRQHGKNYIRRGHAGRLVASIDSLLARHKRGRLALDATLPWRIIIDEAHHVVAENKWGRLRELFPAAQLIGFTATPARMDGESLSSRSGGLFDVLVQADALKDNGVVELIRRGYLSPFRVYSPPEGFTRDRDTLALDPLIAYRRYAAGRRGVAMCASIKNAEELAEQLRAAGVSAASISSRMSQSQSARIIDDYRRGDFSMLCNVDMVGEGFDVPGIDALLLLRRTQSFIAYRQWIGRALRPAPDKTAVIVDLAGNVERHGLPDAPVAWNLDTPPVGPRFVRHAPCVECGVWYSIKHPVCDECGVENALLNRRSIGGHYRDIRYLDVALIERTRADNARAAINARLDTEIIYPYDPLDGGPIGRIAATIKTGFIEALDNSATSRREINRFLESVRGPKFWIDHFTAKDARAMCPRKAARVFKKWQSS